MGMREAILQAVFELCPEDTDTLRLAGKRDSQRMRSTTADPRQALGRLLREFSPQDLIEAGVAREDRYGQLQLVSQLAQAGGTILALRTDQAGPPFELLSPRGPLSAESHPVTLALRDYRSNRLAACYGLMLAVPTIRHAALLDAVDLPATPALGLSHLDLQQCRQLDQLYGEGLGSLAVLEVNLEIEETEEAEDPHSPAAAAEETSWQYLDPVSNPAMRPMLVLCDRFDRRAHEGYSLWLQNSVRCLAEVRRLGGLPLNGIAVCVPDDHIKERWHFACRRRDPLLMREIVLEATESLIDLTDVIEGLAAEESGPLTDPPDYLAARRNLVTQLVDGNQPFDTQEVSLAEAIETYESAVEQQLVEPLIASALNDSEPRTRAVGVQLGEVVHLLHRLAPRVHALQVRDLKTLSAGDTTSPATGLFAQYARLIDRFGRLAGVINQALRS